MSNCKQNNDKECLKICCPDHKDHGVDNRWKPGEENKKK